MRLLIIIFALIPSKGFGVEIHQNGFSNIPAGSGTHYAGRFMQWSVWEETPAYSNFGLPYNHIAAATTNSGDPTLTEDDFYDELSGMSDSSIGLLLEHFEVREFEIPDTQVQAEAVFTSKIQLDIPQNIDIDGLRVSDFKDAMQVADVPHTYTDVSVDFVRGFLPTYYLAKEQLSENDHYQILTINAADDVYNCPWFDRLLRYNDNPLVAFFGGGSAHMFFIVKMSEVNPSDLNGLDGSPDRVFVQEIIYGTSLIRSGKNIVALYQEDSGAKLILQNATVMTDRVMSAPEVALSRLTLEGIASARSRTESGSESENEFILTPQNVEIIDSDNQACGVGLGLGVASYTYNIARRMVEGLSE